MTLSPRPMGEGAGGEGKSRTMINDNQTNTVYFSAKLREPKFADFCSELVTILNRHHTSHHFLQNTNDIWCRDYMPVQVREDVFIEYRYDPDYLLDRQGGKSKTYPDIVCESISLKTVKTDIILDGGNVIKYGNTVIMTDKIIPENASKYLKADLLKKLGKLFETDNIILIPWIHADKKKEDYGHADGMVRFIDDSTVLVDNWYLRPDADYHEKKVIETLKRQHLEIVPLEFSRPLEKQSEDSWGYLNFLQMRDLLLIPSFGIDQDKEAELQFHRLFPDYSQKGQIEMINSKAIIRHGGVLNCISWNIQS